MHLLKKSIPKSQISSSSRRLGNGRLYSFIHSHEGLLKGGSFIFDLDFVVIGVSGI